MVKFVFASWIISSNMLYAPILHTQERIIIGGAFLPVDCSLFFLTSGTSRLFQQYSPEITAKPLVFPRVRVSSSERRKKIRVGQATRQSNRRGINDTAWDDGGCEKKGGETDFLAGKSALWATRAQARIARRASLSLSLARRERSLAWPKGLNWISLN